MRNGAAAPLVTSVARRATRQLEATWIALCATRTHPTAEELHRTVRRELPSISLATVYRNLQKLVADDRARLVAVAERRTRFDGRTDAHDHFVCRACGRVVDVERSRGASRVRRPPLGRHRVEEFSLTYFGRCASCAPAPGAHDAKG